MMTKLALMDLEHRVEVWIDKRPPAIVLTQLFFGLGWARAASEKLISSSWWSGETISAFVVEHKSSTLVWFEPVASAAWMFAPVVAVCVFVAQFAVAASMLTNKMLGLGLAVGTALNLSFIAIGAVNPSAFYVLAQGAIALWLIGSRRPTKRLSDQLRFLAAAGIAVAAVSVPSLQMPHPATVIDDPAAMMITLGGLSALVAELTHRQIFGRSLP